MQYVACYEALVKICGLNLFFDFQMVESISRLLVIYCGNTTALDFSQNDIHSNAQSILI